jgi:tetratricopeptide (TPR) repeat protein
MFNTEGGQALVQMAPKQMKLVVADNEKIQLKGYGNDNMGASFADYGLTIYHNEGNIEKCILHMFDRNVNIIYEKEENKKNTEILNQFSDFEIFKTFTDKWNTSMLMHEKIQIAMQSDNINNQGVSAYNEGDILGAIKYYEKAISIMPNNDDALENLRICFTEIGNQTKASEMAKKLKYLT